MDIAEKVPLTDDHAMSPARARRRTSSGYVAPAHPGTIMLSAALNGTPRFPDANQASFLSDTKNRGDLRIFYAGDLSLLQRPCVSIVGTRQVSDVGARATEHLARKLVDANLVIVSGLAYGVDAVAHTAAIEQGGKTIAVIGTPLDRASPSENAHLQECIYRQHLLISQFRQGERTFRNSFPQRNRLMAVASDATVVMEASDTSGTLHQAAECTKLGRWLFIAKSVAEDPSLQWPKQFLKYDTTIVLERASQITERVFRLYQ
jgi:DNA processing protein